MSARDSEPPVAPAAEYQLILIDNQVIPNNKFSYIDATKHIFTQDSFNYILLIKFLESRRHSYRAYDLWY